jgi:hypothetical protein
MKIDELKLGDKVYDSWYPDWGIGEVVKLFKTTVHIMFPPERGKTIYDKAHVRYLERSKDFFKRKLL